MKKLLLFNIIFITTLSVYAQGQSQIFQKNGFIGISIGPAFAVGDFGDDDLDNFDAGYAETGINITLINFGYLFAENFGVAGAWFGGSHPMEIASEEGIWAYGGLLAGPLVSFQASEQVNIDFKLLVGSTAGIIEVEGEDEDGSGFGLDIGANLRYQTSNKMGIIISLDYFNTEPEFSENVKQQMTAVNLNFGIYLKL